MRTFLEKNQHVFLSYKSLVDDDFFKNDKSIKDKLMNAGSNNDEITDYRSKKTKISTSTTTSGNKKVIVTTTVTTYEMNDGTEKTTTDTKTETVHL